MDFFFSLFMEIIIAEDFSPDVSVAFAGKGVVWRPVDCVNMWKHISLWDLCHSNKDEF